MAEQAFFASMYGGLGGVAGGMVAMSVMIASQLGYYNHKKSGMTPSYSTNVLPGTHIRLIPPGKKNHESATVKAITQEFVVVEYDNERLGTQEVPRLYYDTKSQAERQKGQAWYEVKKAHVCGKCVKHEAEAALCGCLVGAAVANCDEALMNQGVHACAVVPDAACGGLLATCACHGARICWKARKNAAAKEKRKERAKAQARERDRENQRRHPEAVQGIPLPHEEGFDVPPPQHDQHNPYSTAGVGVPYYPQPGELYPSAGLAGKQVVYPEDPPSRGTRGLGSHVSGGSRSRPYAGSPHRSGASPSRVARGVAAADSFAGDAEMSSYWEEKQRRQRIQRLFDQGGDPTAEENRDLFDRRSAPQDTLTDMSHVSNRQPRRKARSAVSSETMDLVSLRDSQMGGSSVAYSSQDEFTRSPGASAVSQSRARAPGPTTRLGVGSSVGW
eukprot:Hpha_TRINITY_DN10852_c0_g1::TRINITY_DN10852_c0_g1_i1::g.23198::m.23198